MPSIGQIAIVATKTVMWSNLAVEPPTGPAVALDAATQASSTSVQRTFAANATTAPGSYTIKGTMNDGTNPPVNFVSHFTLYTQPTITSSTPTPGTSSTNLAESVAQDAPPVERLAEVGKAGALVASNGSVSLSWPKETFADKTIVKVDPVPVTSDTSGNSTPRTTTSGIGAVFAAGGSAVEITATRQSNGAAVTEFTDALEIQFPNAAANVVPSYSKDGLTWIPVAQLPAGVTSFTCNGAQREAYHRDSFNTIHLFTCHLTYFGVLVRPAAAPLAAAVAVAPRPHLAGRQTFGFLVRATKDSTVSAVLRTGKSTLMKWPARQFKAGTYVLKRPLPARSLNGRKTILEVKIVAGKGGIRVFHKVEFLKAPAALPARPIVLLVNGTDSRRTLQGALKARFQIAHFTSNADSYRLIGDPKRKINAVVVDLSKAPAAQSQRLGLIRNLRYLFPSLRIVVATNSAKLRV